MERILTVMGTIFAFVGSLLLAGALLAWQRQVSFGMHALVADGVVVEMTYSGSRSSQRAIVEYQTAGGQTVRFKGAIASRPPAFSVGEKVHVLYDAEHPDDARIDSFMERWFVALLLVALGGVFGGIGFGFLIFIWRARKLKVWLRDNGRTIRARYTGAVHDTSVRMNMRSPWRLLCEWEDPMSRKTHVFRSDAIWFDPSAYVNREELDVRIDPKNPRRYNVDIGFLPKQS